MNVLSASYILTSFVTLQLTHRIEIDLVHASSPVQHTVICSIRIGTLRCGSEVVLLRLVGVHQASQLSGEGVEVLHRRLQVQIESIDDSVMERSVSLSLSTRVSGRVAECLCIRLCGCSFRCRCCRRAGLRGGHFLSSLGSVNGCMSPSHS